MNVQFNIPPFQPTAYYPRYGYTNKNEVPAKQPALVQETKEKQYKLLRILTTIFSCWENTVPFQIPPTQVTVTTSV